MATIKDTYAIIGTTFASRLDEFMAQSTVVDAALRINSMVTPQGRYTKRAPRTTKPKSTTPAVDVDVVSATSVIASEDNIFTRPNGSAYHARKWGEHQDVATLRKAREATAMVMSGVVGSPMFALLYGAPGTGKTALVEGAFGEVNLVMGTGDTEVSDFIGGYVQTPSGGFEWIDGPLLKAAENGEVIFIDEIGLIDPKVLSVVYGAMDGRKEIVVTANPERGAVAIKEGFYVVAATNPNAPGVRLSEALLSRFTIQAEMATDWSLARTLHVPTAIVTCAQNLSKKQSSGEVSWSPQMRELLAFRDIAGVFGNTFAVSNLLASAPEMDRPVVSDVLSRVFGSECKPARI